MGKTLKPPRTQRVFSNGWGELDYLCKKIRYWLYTRKEKVRATRYADRVARVIRALPENESAIVREEALALACELTGNLGDAIAHREREIGLMERLHQEAQLAKYTETTRTYMLQDRSEADLQKRRAILEVLKEERANRQGQDCQRNGVKDADRRLRISQSDVSDDLKEYQA